MTICHVIHCIYTNLEFIYISPYLLNAVPIQSILGKETVDDIEDIFSLRGCQQILA